jgi:nucleoside-diphosphate-sugar epimerase
VHRGDLEDLESLRSGAAKSEGVIHTAFNHDFSNFLAICEQDRKAIEALGDALVGSDRPLLITSGTMMGNAVPGQPATEDIFNPDNPNPRKASELAGVSVADRGVNVSVVRLPQVHDPVKQGLITYAVKLAREKGLSAYLGDGRNRWPAYTSSTQPGSTGWPWKSRKRAAGTTRSLNRECPSATSLKSLPGA